MARKPTYEELEQGVKKLEKICRGYAKSGARERTKDPDKLNKQLRLKIGEREQATEDLEKSERRYRHLVEGLPDIVWSFSDKRGTLFASGRVEKILGYSPEHLYRNPWLWNRSIHPDDKDKVDKVIADFAEGKDFDVEYRINDASGNWRWFHDRSIDRRMEGDEVIIEGISTDITERKRVENEVRKFKTISDNAGYGVSIVDHDGNVIYNNAAYNRMHGYMPGELIGKHLSIFHTKQQMANVNVLIERLNQEGSYIAEEVWHKRKDNSEFQTLMNGTLIKDADGNPLFMAATAIDITKRKRAEEALRRAEDNFRRSLDDSPLGVRIVTEEGETIYANKAILEIYGYDSIEELKATPVKKRYTPESYAEFRIRKKKRQRGGYGPPEYEISIVKKNGEVRHLQVFRKEILWSGERQFQVLYLDITEHKRSEEEKDRLLYAVAASSEGVSITDEEDKYIYANPSHAMIYGYKQGELIGKTWKDITPPEVVAANEKAVIDTLHNKNIGIFSIEAPALRKDGTTTPTEVKATAIWDNKGNYQGHICHVMDITERERAEEALRESEEQNRTLIEAAPDVVYTISGEDGLITSLNPAFENITGWSRGKWIGKSFIEIVHPDDRSVAVKTFEKCCRGETQAPYALRILSKSGEYLIGEFTSTPYVKGGKVIGELGIARDITKRKQVEDALRESEARFSNVFHFSPLSITISTVKDGQLIDVNDAWQRLTGFSREETIGNTAMKLNLWVNPGDRDRILSRLSEEGTVENFEVQVRHKSGRVMDLLMFARSINIAGEQYLLLLAQDITEQKRLEFQMQQRQKMETLGTLVAGVAHEINNPINTIMNNAPLLRSVWKDLLPLIEERVEKEPSCRYGGLTGGFLKENMDQLISDIDMAANRVAVIVKGLKDFSRKTSPLEKQKVDINIAVENAIQLAGSTVKKSGITLALALTPNLPSINANLQNIEQIIMNLLVNAVHAIEHDYGEIRIATTYNKNQGTVVLSVQDNGKGISPAISDKIFDPFFTEWQSIGGTGLGLPITQNLVKANDGEITFRSRPGKGTSFFVTFAVERKKKPFKILLVDDDEVVLEIVKEALTIEPNYIVEKAGDGNEALIKIGIFHPDLLILDIVMPKMDGVEVCRAIQKHPELKDMKVIILTGYPGDEKVKEIAEMGFKKVIAKPFQLEEFMKEVEGMLRI